METQTRKSDWFYDDREYYNYVLLNTTQDVYLKVQQALKSNGIRVLKSAVSFRPASNGIQYKWYIRVEGENFKPPEREKIRDIIEGVLTHEIQVQRTQAIVTQPQKPDETIIAEIEQLRKSLAAKSKEYDDLSSQFAISEKKRKLLQSALSKAETDLEQSRKVTDDLRQQIIGLYKPDDVQKIQSQYEQQLQEKLLELENTRGELKEYIETFQPEIESKNQEIQILQNQIAILEHERQEVLKEKFAEHEKILSHKPIDDETELIISLITKLLDNIEFLRGSLRFIWTELPDSTITDIFTHVKKIDELKAKRVECDPRWKEFHDGNTWRMYFRKCQDKKYQVLISDKDGQKRDWEWLKLQPDC